ncbi:MAG: hypothetical protein V4450_08555 [Bacteroidota bacterium]
MKLLPLLIFSAILFACNSRPHQNTNAAPDIDTAKFYPLHSFFKEQIQYVDLRSFNIYKITVKDGKKDSTGISKDGFLAMAAIFLKRDLSDPNEKIRYKETVFQDLSTGSITFNYTPIDPKATVQNIDILLDEETHTVKRVFIRSVYTSGDSTINEQCNWKAGMSFQVNRTISTKTGYTSTELNYINWNDKP